MNGTTTSPSQLFTHTRNNRYSTVTPMNLAHCTFMFSFAFSLSIIFLSIIRIYLFSVDSIIRSIRIRLSVDTIIPIRVRSMTGH